MDDRRGPLAQSLLLIWLAVAVLALPGCGRLFFYPERELIRTPADIGLAYENVVFTGADGVPLNGWFLPSRGPATATILFLHGNAENISSHIAAVYWLPAEGFNVFLFDYGGFGSSGGKVGVESAVRDADAALAYLRQRPDVDRTRLVLYGQSIGGALALYTAAQHPGVFRAVISESAFSSYPDILREKLSDLWFTWPFQWMACAMTDRYDPVAAVRQLDRAPLLIVHGDRDRIIPVAHALRLYAAAAGDKTLWVIPGGDHIDAFVPPRPENRRRLVEFIRRAVQSPFAPALVGRGDALACR